MLGNETVSLQTWRMTELAYFAVLSRPVVRKLKSFNLWLSTSLKLFTVCIPGIMLKVQTSAFGKPDKQKT